MEILIQKILCPVDFSEYSDHVLRYALAFAAAYDAHLELLHVLDLPFAPVYWADEVADMYPSTERVKALCRQQLDEQVGKCKQTHPSVAGRVVGGNPFAEIVRAAKDGDFDLIVVGTHGRTGLSHMLIGSTAEKVVRHAPCPVLSVKHPEH